MLVFVAPGDAVLILCVDQVAVGISQSLSRSNTVLIYSILIVAVGRLVIYNT